MSYVNAPPRSQDYSLDSSSDEEPQTKLLVCYLVRAGKDPIIGFQNATKSSLVV